MGLHIITRGDYVCDGVRAEYKGKHNEGVPPEMQTADGRRRIVGSKRVAKALEKKWEGAPPYEETIENQNQWVFQSITVDGGEYAHFSFEELRLECYRYCQETYGTPRYYIDPNVNSHETMSPWFEEYTFDEVWDEEAYTYLTLDDDPDYARLSGLPEVSGDKAEKEKRPQQEGEVGEGEVEEEVKDMDTMDDG
ncbi:hypothetical protein CPC08DRAFT_344984 [Agrocybe pediades]|nr:hypothetical protein CPC08DRAFT_344984 [Agrocybe pediades]